ncbi:MAG: hypothetical protein EOM03_13835 [Clostridia bacterium]|nr:hypothetical protein [Clostridia bacterium]
MYDDGNNRLSNGVKVRMDGKGDAWSNAHRDQLGNNAFMQDLDAMFGFAAFGHNTGERLFLEYVPDSWENRHNSMRTFGVVALFDRKASLGAAFSGKNALSSNFYRFLCRLIASAQPIPPRFFYVIGGQEPPWTMVDVDICNGQEIGNRVELTSANFKTMWESLGLGSARNVLMQWTCAA